MSNTTRLPGGHKRARQGERRYGKVVRRTAPERRPRVRGPRLHYRGLLGLLLFIGAVAAALIWRTSAFGVPGALVAVLAVNGVVLLLWLEARRREADRQRLAPAPLLGAMGEPSLRPPLVVRGLALTVAVGLLLLAMARPKGGMGEQVLSGEGVDVFLCLDVSNSMRVRDMAGVSRLDAAKQLLRRFVERSAGDRVGLVGFAGSAHVLCPLTLDHGTLLTFLDDLDYGSVAQQGTAIGDALRTATERFDPEEPGGKVVILLTDGEDHQSDPRGAAAVARDAGVMVYAIGLGTDTGDVIPMGSDPWGNPVYKRYQGAEVTSRLDEGLLRHVAETTGGLYFRADSPSRLYDVLTAIAGMDRKVLTGRKIELREDVYVWYLLPALLLLAWEPLVALRRRRAP